MPFTPSHAVVALPFVRTPLLPAAIAIGAMTPDLPLFVRGTPLTYQVTHTNLIVSSVMALVLLLLWYLLLRPAVRELAPRWLARRLPAEWDLTGIRAWTSVGPRSRRMPSLFPLMVALSLVLGVVTHIVWDAFTHEGRWGLALFPALNDPWGPLLGYKWLQYGSSVGGLAILAIAAFVWFLRRADEPVPALLPAAVRWAWWAALPVALVVAWIIGVASFGPLGGEISVPYIAYRVLPPACAAWAVLTLLLCAVILILRRQSRAR